MKAKLNSCGGDDSGREISIIPKGSKVEKVKKHKEVDTGEMKEYLKKLQELVPCMPKNKKLSKLEVISHVIDYIRELRQTLGLPPCENEDEAFQLLPATDFFTLNRSLTSPTSDKLIPAPLPQGSVPPPVKPNHNSDSFGYQNLSPPLNQRQPLCAISTPRNSDLPQHSREEPTSIMKSAMI